MVTCIGVLFDELELDDNNLESLSESTKETWLWIEPTKQPVAEYRLSYVENAQIIRNNVHSLSVSLVQLGKANTAIVGFSFSRKARHVLIHLEQ